MITRFYTYTSGTGDIYYKMYVCVCEGVEGVCMCEGVEGVCVCVYTCTYQVVQVLCVGRVFRNAVLSTDYG